MTIIPVQPVQKAKHPNLLSPQNPILASLCASAPPETPAASKDRLQDVRIVNLVQIPFP
jgi:hypothetical protein